MDAAYFERLLYEEESPTLDFKRDQYVFVKATDDDKSELLKDILGFANAWRRAVAYILVGVEDVRGGRSLVHGIATHLDDHSLQQFVNNLTNRPVVFHYEALGFEGKQVGIIRIEQQGRPIYLKRDFGKLSKEEVYVRRGSSTDPTKPAKPEEIAQMGLTSEPEDAQVSVEFAEVDRDNTLGTSISLDCEFCVMPPKKQIPAFRFSSLAPIHANEEFWRQLADHEFSRRLWRHLRLQVQNTGRVVAKSVRTELRVESAKRLRIRYPYELPEMPKKKWEIFLLPEKLQDMRPVKRFPGSLSIEKNEERYLIEIECGDLQPGRRVWSDPFVIASGESRTINFVGHIFAENLRQPKETTLSISINVSRTEMTLSDLKSLPSAKEPDEE